MQMAKCVDNSRLFWFYLIILFCFFPSVPLNSLMAAFFIRCFVVVKFNFLFFCQLNTKRRLNTFIRFMHTHCVEQHQPAEYYWIMFIVHLRLFPTTLQIKLDTNQKKQLEIVHEIVFISVVFAFDVLAWAPAGYFLDELDLKWKIFPRVSAVPAHIRFRQCVLLVDIFVCLVAHWVLDETATYKKKRFFSLSLNCPHQWQKRNLSTNEYVR